MADEPKEAGQLLDAARAGSQQALGEALEACRCYLLGIADRELDATLRAKGGASDLVQETFLEAHRDFPRFEGSTEAELLAWLRRMLLNNLSNFNRHYRGTDRRNIGREVSADDDSPASGVVPMAATTPTASRIAMRGEQAEQVRQMLERLPEDYRRILTLRYLEERSFEEIGELMGRTSNAVRKLWARAVERLQQEMPESP